MTIDDDGTEDGKCLMGGEVGKTINLQTRLINNMGYK